MSRIRPTFDLPHRSFTFPGYNTLTRKKPRRWPLVLRVTKGSVHLDIILPVLLHSTFTAIVTYLDLYVRSLGLPGTIIPSLSIVVGLMLVFRNSTSYDRFWTGRNCVAALVTNVKNLARCFIVSSKSLKDNQATDEEKRDTETVVKLLMAFLYAVKHHVRGEFAPRSSPTTPGAPYPTTPIPRRNIDGIMSGAQTPVGPPPPHGVMSQSTPLLAESLTSTLNQLDPQPVYSSLLRNTTIASLEVLGVALPMQLSFSIEAYIRRGLQREWWQAPQAAMLENTLNNLILDWQKMDSEFTLSVMS
jgi:ion channel-forming bestrophin family protein